MFSFIEWCLWNAYDDMTNYQRNFSTGEVEIERDGSTLYHKTEYRERRDHYAFYNVNAHVAGFDTDRESFLGLYNELGRAAGGRARAQSSNSVASGWAPIASHGLDVKLAPGRGEDVRLHARLRRGAARREVGEAGRHQQEAAPTS